MHVRFILVRSNRYPCRISRNIFSDEDLCAISYDNGHIHLYSTFDDTLKLVKGKYRFEGSHMLICFVYEKNLHVILNVFLPLLGLVIDYYVRHQVIKQQLFMMWKQEKKLMYYVAIQ